MARTSSEISQAIRAQAQILDPDVSFDPITPERKIIDLVSEQIAEAELDNYVLDYQYDIDTKVGEDLDRFVGLFGFSRQGGRRATGSVSFKRNVAATQDLLIPAGTQVMKPATRVSPQVTFRTTASVTMFTGTTEVEAPIQSIVIGPAGNVAASTITSIQTGASEISEIENENATTGGTSDETDAQLRVRFKNTIFRNVAGTKDQYLALAIASRFANKANVIGPISRFIEYLQVQNNPGTGVTLGALSQIPYSKYTYPFDYYLTDGQTVNEVFYAPNGVDFTFDSTTSTSVPRFQINNTVLLPVGSIVLLEHSYTSSNSRNDPSNNIGNYVDVYVSGEDIVSAEESTRFPKDSQNMNGTTSSPYYRGNFIRYETGGPADPLSAGNRFQELLWQPTASLPGTITIGTQTYVLNQHYWLVRDITINKGSRRARNGIEWAIDVANAPGLANTEPQFTLTYTFDKLPLSLNELMDAHKQVSADVLVHSALERYFSVRLLIMYTSGFSRTAVDEAITVALTDFMEKMNFGAVIQLSDIIDVVHDVPGVDNVRITSPSDGGPYGIQEIAPDGTTPIGGPYLTDFALQDSDLPVLQEVLTSQRSQNTWG
jgi:uncharacterized phage protein gp47/JayE